jgi:hypothetical protein
MTTARLRLVLELERAGDPITGRLRRVRGPAVPFTGWLELISAVEAAREDPPDPPPDRPGSLPPLGARDERDDDPKGP